MTDLFYTKNELFTKFIPNTEAGEKVWSQVAAQDKDGVFSVTNMEAQSVIAKFKKAGYSVAMLPKSKPLSADELDLMLAELEI